MPRPVGSKNGVYTLIELTCKRCGKPFGVKPSKASRVYCSMECRRHGYRVCEVCGKRYYPKARAQRYCSQPCTGVAKGGIGVITAETLLARTERVGDCLVWTGWTDSLGYGRFKYRGRTVKAYRASYRVFNGRIPKGMDVHHTCRNPPCINPSHLQALTPKEHRAAERVAKRALTI